MTLSEPVTLTNCDREPIHIPGSIQPHGAMLVLDPRDYSLLFASENAAALTGYAGELTPGTFLGDIIGAEVAHELRNAAARTGSPELAGVLLGLTFPGVSGRIDAAIHTHGGRAFVELEPSADDGRSAQQALDLTQTLIRRIGLESSVEGIAASGARLVRAMLGYDRVMVYRFLHNGAGRVVAESRAPGLASFLGQHFPASDIPAQARRLYLINSIRMIADAAYKPVPLHPPLAAGEAPVDMSFAQLRSVSPIHCEYLRNMGVAASLSISIVVDGELWGLISCHHDTPRVTPMPLRIAAELFGQYFSLQVSVGVRRAEMVAAAVARERLDAIMADLSADDATLPRLGDRLADLAALEGCDGAGMWVDGLWRQWGDALPREAIVKLIPVVAEAPRGAIWTSQELRRDAPAAARGAVAGAIAIPLSFVSRDYLFFFRNEESHDILWAGEPVKQAIATPAGERLTPRGSFETWREEVKGRSVPWSDADITVAEAVRTYLRDVVLRQREATAEERAVTEQRRRILNDELNHRVKNIIALVRSIALQTGAGAATVEDYTAALEGRLNALAFAHDQSLNGVGAGDLSTLIEAEASLHRYGAAPDRVVAAGVDVHLDDRTFGVLALVVHEMMTNAAKYGALSTPQGRLDLRWRLTEAGDCEITWRESGGPRVVPPTRDGFGAKLIRSTLEYDLRGLADIAYEPDGLQARFLVPAAHVRLGDAAPASAPAAAAESASLAGLGVLVVEDQGLIALDTEETLRRLGAADIRLAPSVADAEAKLRGFAPDAAVLDFNLGGGTSEAVADVLEARGVPYVFATGYADNVMIPERFRHVPVVRKPINAAALASHLEVARQSAAKARGE